jgi:hypothetical protein
MPNVKSNILLIMAADIDRICNGGAIFTDA